uniref:Uncharacterized protein n=1 Tax=Curvibacter symbiont subsp. Hydra magnipapillata TaxID=667019 RepID=C9YF66_CURXX|nr:hypothetical protein Csp_D32220 [Curvibacter putative symbiont of Hydra magnipapillata]
MSKRNSQVTLLPTGHVSLGFAAGVTSLYKIGFDFEKKAPENA